MATDDARVCSAINTFKSNVYTERRLQKNTSLLTQKISVFTPEQYAEYYRETSAWLEKMEAQWEQMDKPT